MYIYVRVCVCRELSCQNTRLLRADTNQPKKSTNARGRTAATELAGAPSKRDSKCARIHSSRPIKTRRFWCMRAKSSARAK